MPRTEVEILFSGYAPVHFLCFQPLYRRLVDIAGCECFVSGGLKTGPKTEPSFDLAGLYDPFGIPRGRQIAVNELADRSFDVFFGANTKGISPRQSKHSIQLFHGISFRNLAVRNEIRAWDTLFLAGPYMRRKMEESGVIPHPGTNALSIGLPKTDALLNGSLNRATLMEKFQLSGNRPILLYAPTGQKHNSLETMGPDVIRRIRQSQAFDLIVKPHDHPKNPISWATELADLCDDHTRITSEPDVIELLFLADLLITDASSVSSEYSLLDRPMIFLDVPKLLAKTQAKNPNLDLETWGRKAGHIVTEPTQINRIIDQSLAAPEAHRPIRREMAKDLFYNPGRATEAALEWVSRLI